MRSFILKVFLPVTVPWFVGLGVLLGTVGLQMLMPPCTHSKSLSLDKIKGDPSVQWQITAENMEYDTLSETVYFRGNVIIEKQATRLTADRVAFNRKTEHASASGHVMLTVGKDVITGESLQLDMRRETGAIQNGGVFLSDNHFYIRGDQIEKTGKESYRVENASLTSCDGDDPDWAITARTVNVTIEGYGTATHAVFRAADVPLVYTPYLLFPAKSERQTGLLIPMPGYSSRKGVMWDQPFFWAINNHSDATLYTHIMQQRGVKMGLEYRYALSDESFGTIMADGMKDRQVDDGSDYASDKWGYTDDAYTRPNTDRYWLRAKLNQKLPLDATARLDLDVVSDQDYLVEFNDGYSGYDETDKYFLGTFGRDLDTNDENTRTNRLNINKTWSYYAFNAEALWNDNVINRRWNETDNTLQQMPVIMFDSMKQSAFGTGIYWDIESETTYFYREDGQRGYRADLHPRVYLPLRWENYISVEPSAGWRETTWRMDRWEDENLDQSTYRHIYDLELDISTELSKVMDSSLKHVDRIRHSIKPQVTYTYIPDEDQSELPYFTDEDRIDAANQITYSLTNTFTARLDQDQPPPTDMQTDEFPSLLSDTGMPSDTSSPTQTARQMARQRARQDDIMLYNYLRFCRFYLEQTYDITKARNNESETLSDLYGEMDFRLNRYVALNADAEYDTYETRFSSHNVGGILKDWRGDKLAVEHRYKTRVNESIRSALSLKVTDSLLLRGTYERDLLKDKNISRGGGFIYKNPCWVIGLFYTKEDNDEKYRFLINLTGIGGTSG